MAIDPGPRAWPKIAAVAWREFRYTALTKAFIFGAIGVPAFMVVLVMALPMVMKSTTTVVRGTVTIIDPTGEVAPHLERLLAREAAESSEGSRRDDIGGGPLELTLVRESDAANLETLIGSLGDDGSVAVVRVPDGLLEDPSSSKSTWELDLVVQNATPWHVTQRLERMSRSAAVEARLAHLGIDATQMRALMQPPRITSQRVSPQGGLKKEDVFSRLMLPVGFMMLLWICVFTSGQYLLTTTIEEKSSRVMEVLLSAVSPMQLLTGKLLGQAMVSMVMLGMYTGAGVSMLVFLAMADLVQPIQYLWLLLYFAMAYFMVATMMVAVGSAVSDLREAQALITPVMLILMVPLFLWLPISTAPNGGFATAASFIPPAIPFVMILRLASTSEPVPMWQIALSLVAGFASVMVMLWAAARIFRVGILMQGKPPTPRELLRWTLVR
ncbi:MAG: ABC transporter permease [Phycisphaeraceae bacterium]|nr:ABC transporter permease [Phycisphaeraceae bacterium]